LDPLPVLDLLPVLDPLPVPDSSTIVPIQGPSMIVPIPGPSTIVPSMEDYDDSPIASLDSNNYSNSQQTNLRNRSAPNERQMELNELNQQQLENRNFPTVDLTGIIDDNSDDMDGMDNNTGQNENLNRFTEEDNTDAVLERTTLNAIQFLAQQLVFGHGCTTEEHTEWQEGLEADRAGEVENQAENGIHLEYMRTEPVHRVLEPKGKDLQFIPLSSDKCRQVFEGTCLIEDNDNETITYVVLYKQQIVNSSDISYDIDSFIALPISLGVAKKGLKLCFYATRILNINTNIHLTTLVSDEDELKPVSYHKVPHCYLGNLCYFEDCRLFIFFPDLYCRDSERIFLTDNEYSVSLIFYFKLSTMFKPEKAEPWIQMFHYTVPPKGLYEVWNIVLQKLSLPGFQDLGQPILLLDAKNTKTLFRSESPSQVISNFQETWNFSMDKDFLIPEKTWIDIGKEVVPPKTEHGRAYTYLWKDCCLRKTLYHFQLGMAKPGFQTQFYPWGLIASSSNMTFSVGKRHPLMRCGLVYSQFYSSIKEPFDAGKTYPYNNVNLEALAVDSNLHKLWSAESGHTKGNWDRQRLLKAYIASKERVNIVLSASKDKCYGIREEHRENSIDCINLPFQIIPTGDIMQFLYNISRRDRLNEKPRQGIGLSKTLETMQYGFIQAGKIDWNTWQFKPAISKHILFNHNALRSKHIEIWTSESRWWTFDRKFDAIASVWYWMAETLIWGFELEVLTTLEKDGSLELDRKADGSVDPNDIRFCEEDMQELLEYRIEFGTDKGKSALSRQGWEDKKYRVLYKTLVENWNVHLGEKVSWIWDDTEFLKQFVRKCWIWPNATTIENITSTAGSVQCIGYNLTHQLQWKWLLAIQRRQSFRNSIDPFSGIAITRVYYHAYCRTKGYFLGGETQSEQNLRFAELMNLSRSHFEGIYKIAMQLYKGKKWKVTIDLT
ncbi:hypothetical protein BGX38DRAFT_1183094, partial [Terfezia claveryi]